MDVGYGATVGDRCVISGDNVTIGALASTGTDCRIGARTVIARSASFGSGAVLGDDVVIGPSVVAGDNVELGARTRLRKDVQLGDDVSLGEDGRIGRGAILEQGVEGGDDVQIGSRAQVGAYTVLLPGEVVLRGVVIEPSDPPEDDSVVIHSRGQRPQRRRSHPHRRSRAGLVHGRRCADLRRLL